MLPAKGSREGSGAEPAQPRSVPLSPTTPAGLHEPPPLFQGLGRGRDRPTTTALAHPWGEPPLPRGYWMHSVEFPTTISCRSHAITTARCRLRGRMHLWGNPTGSGRAAPSPTAAPGLPRSPHAWSRDTRDNPTRPGVAAELGRPQQRVEHPGVCGGGHSQGATHQTICLGGARMLQLNSQNFSWERNESGRGEGRWCACCWSHAPRGAIRGENQHRAHVLLKKLAPAPAPERARARLAQPKGEDAVWALKPSVRSIYLLLWCAAHLHVKQGTAGAQPRPASGQRLKETKLLQGGT